MNCGILYEGFFLQHPLPGKLEHTLLYQHVLTEYLPEETHNALWGKKATINFIGYGCNETNEGYLVSISSSDPELKEVVATLPEQLFITTSLSKDGKVEDTKDLKFEPCCMEPQEVTYGGYNENMKIPFFVRRDTEVYVEPRYSFHGTGDELFKQAINGQFHDVAQIYRLREILYNEQKYRKAAIVGCIRDSLNERRSHPGDKFNLNEIKVKIHGNGIFDMNFVPYQNDFMIRVTYLPRKDTDGVTVEVTKNEDPFFNLKTVYPVETFLSKDRNSFDIELSGAIYDALKNSIYGSVRNEEDQDLVEERD